MATVHAKRTLGTLSSNYKEWLADLYTYFNGVSPNWQIKAGVTKPAQVSAVGDQGFVIEDVATQTINIAIGAPSLVGSTLISGGAVSGADGPVVGIDPGGGITDLTSASFAAGARWSKWAVNADGSSYNLWLTYKLVDAADYIAIRTKTTSTGEYDGGFFAGKYLSFAARHSGFGVLAGTWTSWGAMTADAGTYELDSAGRWSVSGRMYVATTNAVTLSVHQASDGAGAYNYSRAALTCYNSSSGTDGAPFGLLPHLFHSVVDAAGKRWTIGGSVAMANLNGGSWLWLDDGTNAE